MSNRIARTSGLYNDEFTHAGFTWNEARRSWVREWGKYRIEMHSVSCNRYFHIYDDGQSILRWPFPVETWGVFCDLLSALGIEVAQ